MKYIIYWYVDELSFAMKVNTISVFISNVTEVTRGKTFRTLINFTF